MMPPSREVGLEEACLEEGGLEEDSIEGGPSSEAVNTKFK